MANCTKLFLDFNQEITVPAAKIARLKQSRKNIEATIIKYFQNKEGVSVPKFWIQGSYKMGTMIRTKDDTCDADLGVYFLTKPTVTASTAQRYVHTAVSDITTAGAEHRKKCVRVIYSGDYHVDLPVYYKEANDTHPSLAYKDNGWELSDPKEFYEWFKSKKDDKGQLLRIIKYLKVWCNLRAFKTPSGIALSVWGASYFVSNDRDDIAFLDTLKKIQSNLNANCDCYIPTTPQDNLTGKLDVNQKNKFKDALNSIITDGTAAIASKNQLAASKLWQNHLGDRFPDGADEDVDAKESSLRNTSGVILSGGAYTNRDGHIQAVEGVKNQYHRNYGE